MLVDDQMCEKFSEDLQMFSGIENVSNSHEYLDRPDISRIAIRRSIYFKKWKVNVIKLLASAGGFSLNKVYKWKVTLKLALNLLFFIRHAAEWAT